MTMGFVKREPTNHHKLFRNPEVIGILYKLGWIDYFQKLNRFNEEVAMEFATNMKKENDEKSIMEVIGLKINLTEETLILVTWIPKGKRWDKDERESIERDKNTFFKLYETYKEDKNGIKINSK